MPTPERIAALLALGDPFRAWSREKRRLAAYVLWRRYCQPRAWTRVRLAAEVGRSPSALVALERRAIERMADAFSVTWPVERLDPGSPLGQAVRYELGYLPMTEGEVSAGVRVVFPVKAFHIDWSRVPGYLIGGVPCLIVPENDDADT